MNHADDDFFKKLAKAKTIVLIVFITLLIALWFLSEVAWAIVISWVVAGVVIDQAVEIYLSRRFK